ncbi:MAG TPA: esterase-like activity of phytase family protein [Mesorhizobium sp.]|jgi:hypothetical protein|nr:esterase-like activity of phytase family protein [Mesorhizobium sp.]
MFYSRSFRRAALALLPATALLFGLAAAHRPALSSALKPFTVEVTARPIKEFAIGRAETRFGALEFAGGLELSGSSSEFGGLSAFRFLDGGESLLGVTDTGFWFDARIERDAAGRPAGVSRFSMQPILDEEGRGVAEKWEADAEGLGIVDGTAVVSFERNHRIAAFDLKPGAMGRSTGSLPFLVPAHELRQNRGFETVAVAPAESPLEGAIVVASEKSLDKRGNIFGAVLSGPRKGIFTVRRDEPFDITDGDFLPNGDLLLLERSFSMVAGVAMRLRLIPGEEIRPGEIAEGEVVLEADMSFQIDNMEALDVWRRADGATVVSLMSDDNLSLLQRNLYLEFVLHED